MRTAPLIVPPTREPRPRLTRLIGTPSLPVLALATQSVPAPSRATTSVADDDAQRHASPVRDAVTRNELTHEIHDDGVEKGYPDMACQKQPKRCQRDEPNNSRLRNKPIDLVCPINAVEESGIAPPDLRLQPCRRCLPLSLPPHFRSA